RIRAERNGARRVESIDLSIVRSAIDAPDGKSIRLVPVGCRVDCLDERRHPMAVEAERSGIQAGNPQRVHGVRIAQSETSWRYESAALTRRQTHLPRTIARH